MLRAGPEIDPHGRRLRQIVAARVGMNERAAPLPILGRGLRVDDKRIGLGPLQDRIAPTGQVVGSLCIRERERVGRVEVVLVLLAARHDRIRKPMVQPFASGAGDMRQDPVEHLAAGGIGIEAAIDEIADATSGLRSAPSVGFFDLAKAYAIIGSIS